MGLVISELNRLQMGASMPVHHTIVLGPRYRELLTDVFKRKHLADDFSLYLHRPTASEPGMAPLR